MLKIPKLAQGNTDPKIIFRDAIFLLIFLAVARAAMHTLLAVPLVVRGACAGVCVVGRTHAPLGDPDLRALERFASLVAPAVLGCWQYL